MTSQRFRQVKRAKKESFLFREIANLFLQVSLDEPRVQGLFVSRVKLSPDKGRCTVFFHSLKGKPDFEEKLSILILYKPSMRSAIAKAMQSRYTPELTFAYDEDLEKQQKIDDLIEKLKKEGKL
ncbi:MAG: 30S ribosome-binding factor RbfA [bacterium]|nr:30S ribosome-binding factor RbfA [bacterium]